MLGYHDIKARFIEAIEKCDTIANFKGKKSFIKHRVIQNNVQNSCKSHFISFKEQKTSEVKYKVKLTPASLL